MNKINVDLRLGNCLDVMKTMDDNSVDSIVTDPPYGLSFMGKKWDIEVPSVAIWEECFRILKPGGYLLSFAGTRTQHRMACNIEDAGFEIRDMIAWVYGCLDTETQVATIDGVKHYHETKIGELVLCYDALNNEYTYQPILEIVEYDYNDTAYRITGDFGEQVVSRNHRCIVERNGKEVFNFAETLESEVHVPFLESLSELQQAVFSSKSNSSITEQNMQQGIRKWKGHKTALVRVVPFQYVGKVWCLRVPTGAFVAVRNGVAFPTGNSGFPKSLNISKAIDKAAGATRKVVGIACGVGMSASVPSVGTFRDDAWIPKGPDLEITEPSTDDAKHWDGWGTALKPALEPITVARKPLSESTVAANVLKHGAGGINIDGCRVGFSENDDSCIDKNYQHNASSEYIPGEFKNNSEGNHISLCKSSGRWPANFIHDGSEEVIDLFPVTKSGAMKHEVGAYNSESNTGFLKGRSGPSNQHGDSGSAARFFYCPKASKHDRGDGNNHPTVKPTELMKYLVRLVTPLGGTTLDPFLGSGSTGKAAVLEGINFIGIEMDEAHLELSRSRINAVLENNVVSVIVDNKNEVPVVKIETSNSLEEFWA